MFTDETRCHPKSGNKKFEVVPITSIDDAYLYTNRNLVSMLKKIIHNETGKPIEVGGFVVSAHNQSVYPFYITKEQAAEYVPVQR